MPATCETPVMPEDLVKPTRTASENERFLSWQTWAGAYEAHLSSQDVPQLRQFIKFEATQPTSDWRYR